MPQNSIDRIIDLDEHTLLATLAVQVLTIPRVQSDAIALFPGLGEDARVMHAVNRWESDPLLDRFFVAGVNVHERTYKPLNLNALISSPFDLRRRYHVHTQVEATHTADQARWLVEEARRHRVQTLALVAPAYHMVRAFLTVLKQCIKSDVQLQLIPDPVWYPPGTIVPELEIAAEHLIPGEMRRILLYQEKGDVATLEELMCHLAAFR